MAGIKKLKAGGSAHLDGFVDSDVCSGNNSLKRSSPNGQGYTTAGTKYVEWPYDPAGNKDGGAVNPPSNRVVPPSNSTKINTGLN